MATGLGGSGAGVDSVICKTRFPEQLAGGTRRAWGWYLPADNYVGNNGLSHVTQWFKNPPARQEAWVESLGREDPLE